MRCHYIYDKEAGKVWIPGCWGGLYDPEGCTCTDEITEFESRLYNRKVAELKKENKELQKEVFRLHRIIKKLLKQ